MLADELSPLTAALASPWGHVPHTSWLRLDDPVQHSAALGLGRAACLAPSNGLRTELFRNEKRKKRKTKRDEGYLHNADFVLRYLADSCVVYICSSDYFFKRPR